MSIQIESSELESRGAVVRAAQTCSCCGQFYYSQYAVQGIDGDGDGVMCFRCWFTREVPKR